MEDGVGCKPINAKMSLSSNVNCRVLSLHCKYEALWAGFVVQAREVERTHESIVSFDTQVLRQPAGKRPSEGRWQGAARRVMLALQRLGALACLGWWKVSTMPSSSC